MSNSYVFILFSLTCVALGSVAQDKIVTLSHDTLNVQVVESTDELVKFKYAKENAITSLNKGKVERILYESGRVEVCNAIKNIPTITSKDDWEKVIITFDAKDVLGLSKVGDVEGKSGVGGVMSVQGGENAMKDMKKDAAKMGAGIVLITKGWDKEKDKPISGYGRGVKLAGVAYK